MDDDEGTSKVALKLPVEEAGAVVTVLPSKVMVTVEVGSKPVPEIFTAVPTGPKLGLSIMAVEDVTVKVFEAESVPWVAVTV